MFALTSKKILIVAVFLCSLIYLPGISGPFLFDDRSNITNNSLLLVTRLDAHTLADAAFSGQAGPFKRPLAMLSFGLNHYFSEGFKAPHFKLTNIFIHGLNSTLLLILALQLLNRTHSKNNQYLVFYAGLITILWSLHPINLTSVLYIVQRMTALSTLFSLCTIILYIKARNSSVNSKTTRGSYYIFSLSLLCLIFAIMSKENAILVPLLILLIEQTLFSKEKPWPHILQAPKQLKITGFITFAVLSLVFSIWLIDYASVGYNNRPFNMLERVLTESRVICFYISLILLPRIDGFALFHDDIVISTSLLSPWTTITSFIFILGLLITTFYYRKKNPLFALGISWFFIGHIIESTFFPLEIAHEHRNHLPSIGIIIAAFSLVPIRKLESKKAIAAIIFIAFILGLTTILRATQWSDYKTLAFYEAKHNSASPATQAMLSNAAHQAGAIEVAITAIENAIRLDPTETAYALQYQHMLAEINHTIPIQLKNSTIEKVRFNRISPSTLGSLINISHCLNKPHCRSIKKEYSQWLNILIKNNPQNSRLHYLNGKGLLASNHIQLAINSFKISHKLDNTFIEPLLEIIAILVNHGQFHQADKVFNLAKNRNQLRTIPFRNKLDKFKTVIESAKKTRASERLD